MDNQGFYGYQVWPSIGIMLGLMMDIKYLAVLIVYQLPPKDMV